MEPVFCKGKFKEKTGAPQTTTPTSVWNIHLVSHPSASYGFLHILRFLRTGRKVNTKLSRETRSKLGFTPALKRKRYLFNLNAKC